MAENTGQERTEEATPRRKEKLRSEGKVPKSPDVDAVLVVASVLATLAAMSQGNAVRVSTFAERALSLKDVGRPFEAVLLLRSTLIGVLGPVVLVAALTAVLSGAVQTRGLFSPKLIAFKPERLNPGPQLKRILPGKDSIGELAKQLLKIGALGVVVVLVIREAMPRFYVLAATEPEAGAAAVGATAVRLVLHALAAFAAVAALDWWIAFRRHREESKMSKQDVKDEHKQEEGDPQIKAKRRARAKELLAQQTLAEVENATVLVANPTHYSVALRYEPDRDAAPVVLAKGLDELALRMRKAARRHGVPVVENRPLARALHAEGKVGRAIPLTLYEATAAVVAHVLRLRAGTVAAS